MAEVHAQISCACGSVLIARTDQGIGYLRELAVKEGWCRVKDKDPASWTCYHCLTNSDSPRMKTPVDSLVMLGPVAQWLLGDPRFKGSLNENERKAAEHAIRLMKEREEDKHNPPVQG